MFTRQTASDIAHKASDELATIYGNRFRGVYLFGSFARGKADEDSDIDIAIVLDEVPDYVAEIERTSDLFCDLTLEAGVLVNRIFVSETDFCAGRYALYRAIQREGVPV